VEGELRGKGQPSRFRTKVIKDRESERWIYRETNHWTDRQTVGPKPETDEYAHKGWRKGGDGRVLPSGMASMRFVERSSSTSDSRPAISDGSASRRLSARLPP
jgi:hypothetical protein